MQISRGLAQKPPELAQILVGNVQIDKGNDQIEQCLRKKRVRHGQGSGANPRKVRFVEVAQKTAGNSHISWEMCKYPED
ncbi:hypothetical protein J2S13_002710 [Oikeobacillus pervagus]|uniref:Uncharacterized protein n=1 Tax=Oikeobacillus pervagus TaxID=1325931 RepID=A0AAJ1T0Y5_9BACI|nr:hypothetical protein [Oikeobacillus pervagus]